jgi:pimeloyl-ACP methyl ester carboxylesterase
MAVTAETSADATTPASSTGRYFNEVDKGGHFAAWEQPELFSTEIRAGFRALRT